MHQMNFLQINLYYTEMNHLCRISVVFRVRSAQRVKISDGDLIKRLLLITFVCAAYLTARTIAGTPRVAEGTMNFRLRINNGRLDKGSIYLSIAIHLPWI